jgi:hypothetical protein
MSRIQPSCSENCDQKPGGRAPHELPRGAAHNSGDDLILIHAAFFLTESNQIVVSRAISLWLCLSGWQREIRALNRLLWDFAGHALFTNFLDLTTPIKVAIGESSIQVFLKKSKGAISTPV